MKAGGNTWTGVAFNAQGEIITTSQDLGNAPLAEFRFADGTTGQAWARGRNDIVGLALLRPVGAARTYPFLPFASSPPAVNTAYGLVQYSGVAGAAPTAFSTRVTRFRPGFNGYNYLQIQAGDNTATNGAVVINAAGQIQGIRLPRAYLVSKAIGAASEVYAVASAEVRARAVPLLRREGPNDCPRPSVGAGGRVPSAPPTFPVIFYGQVDIDGQSAPRGARIYARLIKAGKSDAWDCLTTRQGGRYEFPVTVDEGGYDNAKVEFWVDGKLSSVTGVYNTGRVGLIVNLDLAF